MILNSRLYSIFPITLYTLQDSHSISTATNRQNMTRVARMPWHRKDDEDI